MSRLARMRSPTDSAHTRSSRSLSRCSPGGRPPSLLRRARAPRIWSSRVAQLRGEEEASRHCSNERAPFERCRAGMKRSEHTATESRVHPSAESVPDCSTKCSKAEARAHFNAEELQTPASRLLDTGCESSSRLVDQSNLCSDVDSRFLGFRSHPQTFEPSRLARFVETPLTVVLLSSASIRYVRSSRWRRQCRPGREAARGTQDHPDAGIIGQRSSEMQPASTSKLPT